MLSRYRRFYGDSDEDVMKMPVRRFFIYVKNIKKLQAEENLLWLRIVSHPYMDHQKGDDGFVENLYRAVGIENKKAMKQIATSFEAANWGIKIVTREAGEESASRRNQGKDNG
jgi:metal-dependent hydrolase (beta-lactamase superfamily II)